MLMTHSHPEGRLIKEDTHFYPYCNTLRSTLIIILVDTTITHKSDYHSMYNSAFHELHEYQVVKQSTQEVSKPSQVLQLEWY